MCALVSIIMPSYNAEAVIAHSIDSVLSQTYTAWELIITDDNSSDSTCEIVREYINKDERIKLLRLEGNSGAGIARNNSIRHANGRFIAFLDSDDMWCPEKLEKQIKFMLDNAYALTYTQYRKIDDVGNITGIIHPPERVNYRELLKSNVIGCLTAVYDTKILGKVFMPTIRKRQDMALWLNILKTIDYAWCLPEELALYREGHESLSSNKVKILATQWDFYRNHLRFNVIKTAWFFSFYIIRALKKHGVRKSVQTPHS